MRCNNQIHQGMRQSCLGAWSIRPPPTTSSTRTDISDPTSTSDSTALTPNTIRSGHTCGLPSGRVGTDPVSRKGSSLPSQHKHSLGRSNGHKIVIHSDFQSTSLHRVSTTFCLLYIQNKPLCIYNTFFLVMFKIFLFQIRPYTLFL